MTSFAGGYGATLLDTIYQVENCCSEKRGFPIILGRDFVGRVEATGLKVTNVRAGDEVWGVIAPWAQGAHAQKVIVPACNVSVIGHGVNLKDSSFLPAQLQPEIMLYFTTCSNPISQKIFGRFDGNQQTYQSRKWLRFRTSLSQPGQR